MSDAASRSTPATAPTKSFVDVLVIGAGPSGLMAATALKRAGVDVRIVDKRPHAIATGHADGIQPRTIEVLQSFGLADELLRQACQIHLAAFYHPSSQGDGIELTGRTPCMAVPDARYPFIATLHQGSVEKMFIDALRAMDLHVERPVAPTAISLSEDAAVLRDPEAYAVKVHLQTPDASQSTSPEVVNARFVLGTDGARSWVRKALGLALEGEQTDFYWGVIDFVPETDFPDARALCALHTHHGSVLWIPRERDMVRVYVQLEKSALELNEAGDVSRSKMSPERLLQAAKLCLQPYHIDLKDPSVGYDWWTIYRIGQRVANKFDMHSRVFLAGDATHTHSPKAGQGMNAGICDAHNLAWKIAYVLRGHAGLELLQTYELERRRYAQELIAFDKEFAGLFSTKPYSEANANGITRDEFFRTYIKSTPFISGISIRYGPSMITNADHQDLAPDLVVGQRFPPHVFIRAADGKPVEVQDLLPANGLFKLLVFTGERTRAGFAATVQQFAEALVTALARFGITAVSEFMDVVMILGGKLDPGSVLAIPTVLRPHWSRVLVDDVDVHRRHPGGGYAQYGVDPLRGAAVLARPDSFVGAICPLDEGQMLLKYFEGFMRPC
ncbi:FAD binding domain-containing protein [Schizophyllum fasciatum]